MDANGEGGIDASGQVRQKGLEVVVVTAQRRAESLQDVPLSVAAYGQADITRLAVSGIDDLARLTPDLAVGISIAYAPKISIRGIAAGDIGSATTGIYIDDTPTQVRYMGAGLTSADAYPTVFDLDRIEVLRGPQGTLFGAGSEGGAVRFITPEPSFTAYTGHARAEFGFNGLGAPSYQLGAAVGGPLLPDRLAFRVSAYVQEDGGWIDRRPYPSPYVSDKNVNSVRTTTLNAALAWAITDNLTVTPKVFFQNLTSGGPSSYWRNLSNPSSEDFVVGFLTNRPTLDQFSLPSLKVEWRTRNVSLISNTSYMNRTRTSTDDSTFAVAAFFAGDWTGTNAFTPDFNENPQLQFTQEIRLQSTDSNARLTWVVGAFYQTLDERARQVSYSPDFASVNQAVFGQTVQQLFGEPVLPGDIVYVANDTSHDIQKAAFGQVDIRLFDKLTATAGFRYSKMGFRYTSSADGPTNGGPTGSSGSSSGSFSTPKFGLDYKPTEGLMFYASAAKGFRPGATNTSIPASLCAGDLHTLGYASEPLSYDPDYVWSYEVGSKGDLLQHRLLWDASVYDVQWSKTQTSLYLPTCAANFIANVGAAASKGVDLHAKFAVSEHLTIEGSLGHDDAKFSKTLHFPGASGNIVTNGQPLGTPPWHGFVGADYEFTPLPNKTRIYVHMDDSYTNSLKYGSPEDAGYDPTISGVEAVNLLSARIGIRGESWDASLFSKNLLNAHPIVNPPLRVPQSLYYDFTLPPRLIGITSTYRF